MTSIVCCRDCLNSGNNAVALGLAFVRLSLRRLDSVKGTLERNILFKRFVLAQVNKCREGFYGRRNESSTATTDLGIYKL